MPGNCWSLRRDSQVSLASWKRIVRGRANTVRNQNREDGADSALEMEMDMFQPCWGWTESCIYPDQSSPTGPFIIKPSIPTSRDVRSDRPALGLLAIPLHQRHRVGVLERMGNLHPIHLTAFPMQPCPAERCNLSLLFWDRSTGCEALGWPDRDGAVGGRMRGRCQLLRSKPELRVGMEGWGAGSGSSGGRAVALFLALGLENGPLAGVWL